MNKLEDRLDEEFRNLGVKVYVYHFTEGVAPFNAVTISDDEKHTWIEMKKTLYEGFAHKTMWKSNLQPASKFIYIMKDMGIHGVSICDMRDQFNRERGRIIAKGRLLKHLKYYRYKHFKEDDSQWKE